MLRTIIQGTTDVDTLSGFAEGKLIRFILDFSWVSGQPIYFYLSEQKIYS